MSKRAEQRALEAYPDYPTMDGGYVTQRRPRKVFVQGYKQAENDLALTWGDIQMIDHFILQLVNEEREGKDWGDGEKFYTEVLNRFNKSKEGGK